MFGVGSEICAQIFESSGFDLLDAPVIRLFLLIRVTGADIPTPYAANLEARSFPTSDDIVKSVHKMLGE